MSKKRVERLIRETGVHAIAKKKYRATTDSKHSLPVAANHLNRNFKVNKLDQFWVADITYVYTQEGWLYLSTIMDLYSRKIVGWSMKNRITQELVSEALHMAIKQRKPSQGLLKRYSMLCSMSRKGNCWDNAVMESFYRTLKVELIYPKKYETRIEAQRDIFEYIEIFYNRERLHSSIGYNSPEDYEKMTMIA